uniref:Protein phosphatase 1 regulatory subunit 35 C-terminal domain-containing protein n=2 Tax=Biomphalaria glabrata TaxID=6526 RepID=A0A2C9LUS6_BIOGL
MIMISSCDDRLQTTMPPPTTTAVVSEYENFVSHNSEGRKYNVATESGDNLDTLFYSKFLEQKISNCPKGNTSLQNISNMPSKSQPETTHFIDEKSPIKSKNKIPIPYAWSPSLSKLLHPSISITPEKTPKCNSDSNILYGGTSIESQVVNKIPQPAAWSPGMIVHPDPSLFITPEKSAAKRDGGDSPEYDYSNSVLILKTIDQKENIKGNYKVLKTKEKQCVRFDLPSASSGEETLDEFTTPESPITLKGSSVNGNSSSPVWKPFSLQRSYNPNDYSDDSILDDSAISTPVTSCRNFSTPYNVADSLERNGEQKEVTVNVQQSSGIVTSDKFVTDESVKTTSLPEFSKVSSDKNILNLSKSHMLLSRSPSKTKEADKLKQLKDEGKFLRSCSEPILTPSLSVVREGREKAATTKYSFPFESGVVRDKSEYEHIFARPEFNSTLKIRGELDLISHQEVDAVKALETVLAKSETKRTELNEKAAACTNRRSNQFRDLVDIDPCMETLCDRVVRMRTNKIQNKTKTSKVIKKTDDNAPDLMEFFSYDLQKETPDLSMPGLAYTSPQLAIAPQEIAFDLYRHNRMWLGIKDF